MSRKAQSDCEALMNSVLPFAKQMLNIAGEFHPYGAVMGAGGKINDIAAYDGQEHPKSADLIALIKEGFVAGAKTGEHKATALVYDVRIKLPASDTKSDAIAISLNHRDTYSIIVLFPYTIENGKVALGDALAQKGEADIFPAS